MLQGLGWFCYHLYPQMCLTHSRGTRYFDKYFIVEYNNYGKKTLSSFPRLCDNETVVIFLMSWGNGRHASPATGMASSFSPSVSTKAQGKDAIRSVLNGEVRKTPQRWEVAPFPAPRGEKERSWRVTHCSGNILRRPKNAISIKLDKSHFSVWVDSSYAVWTWSSQLPDGFNGNIRDLSPPIIYFYFKCYLPLCFIVILPFEKNKAQVYDNLQVKISNISFSLAI